MFGSFCHGVDLKETPTILTGRAKENSEASYYLFKMISFPYYHCNPSCSCGEVKSICDQNWNLKNLVPNKKMSSIVIKVAIKVSSFVLWIKSLCITMHAWYFVHNNSWRNLSRTGFTVTAHGSWSPWLVLTMSAVQGRRVSRNSCVIVNFWDWLRRGKLQSQVFRFGSVSHTGPGPLADCYLKRTIKLLLFLLCFTWVTLKLSDG